MQKKRRSSSKFLLFILLFLLVFLFIIGIYIFTSFHLAEKTGTSPGDSHAAGSISLPALYSPNAVLIDLNTGSTLAGKNENARIYPASLTKIMTALLAIENLADLNGTVTFDADLFQPLYLMQASMAGFEPGETATFRDLLYGVLLPSGAECCEALCREISGSEAAFAEQMNQRAQSLGMKNTHFANATGLHDENHYTTVNDLSLLLTEALKNDTFRTIFTTDRYSVHPTNLHPDGFTFFSTMFQSLNTPFIGNGEILGGKTGYTDEAGLCLASLYQLDGKEYILITAGASGSHNTEPYHIEDAQAVYGQLNKS